MNECWQEDPVFFSFLGQAGDVHERGREIRRERERERVERVERRREKAQKEAVIEAIQHW